MVNRKLQKILVTGGAGFIGSHLVDSLMDTGYEVRVLDNLSTGKLTNIQRHLHDVDFVKGDICDRDIVQKSVSDIDAVVHLAAITSVAFSVEHPDLTFKNNVMGTLNLLDACVRANVKNFVFASSAAVYGDPQYLPVDENHPTQPLSPYGSSKMEGEVRCKIFMEEHGLKTVALRIFNAYGPRQMLNAYSGVITHFMDRMRREEPLVIFGDGSITRDFVHVWDVREALLKALMAENAKGEIVNIGSGKATSINDLAKTVLDLAGKDLGIVYEEPKIGDIKASVADISKAEKLLHFKPSVPLRKGLETLFDSKETESA